MSEKKSYSFNFGGCGCVTVLIQIIAFILICNIFGCEWAERTTERGVNYIKELCK